jgi:hypothetical protein
MTPLPSLFDKMIEAAKHRKRSNSLQLKSKVDDPFALSPIPEAPEGPSSDPVEVHKVRQPSDTPIEVEDELEPVTHQPSATSDRMDFEDTPIVFSESVYPNPPVPVVPPPVAATVPPLVREEVVMNFPPSNPLDAYLGPSVAP